MLCRVYHFGIRLAFFSSGRSSDLEASSPVQAARHKPWLQAAASSGGEMRPAGHFKASRVIWGRGIGLVFVLIGRVLGLRIYSARVES